MLCLHLISPLPRLCLCIERVSMVLCELIPLYVLKHLFVFLSKLFSSTTVNCANYLQWEVSKVLRDSVSFQPFNFDSISVSIDTLATHFVQFGFPSVFQISKSIITHIMYFICYVTFLDGILRTFMRFILTLFNWINDTFLVRNPFLYQRNYILDQRWKWLGIHPHHKGLVIDK